MKHLLIFTDLDGTLLDHDNYRWDAAAPALVKIKSSGFPLVLSSSKTAAELLSLRALLDNDDPFIVENGGAVAVPKGYFSQEPTPDEDPDWIRFAPDYGTIVHVLDRLRTESGYGFRGFHNMSADEVGLRTGLSADDSRKAKAREASEPIVWQDSRKSLEAFRERLREYGLKLTRGGRFYHVTGRCDKGQGLAWLRAHYQKAWPERQWISVALGDGPNDRSMLETADIAVVMKPTRGPAMHLANGKRVLYPDLPGPAGWRQAMEQILGECLDG
ncbi:MAG: HAD-IIB family hydrolase [Gammaproteobacteria bacterium]